MNLSYCNTSVEDCQSITLPIATVFHIFKIFHPEVAIPPLPLSQNLKYAIILQKTAEKHLLHV